MSDDATNESGFFLFVGILGQLSNIRTIESRTENALRKVGVWITIHSSTRDCCWKWTVLSRTAERRVRRIFSWWVLLDFW